MEGLQTVWGWQPALYLFLGGLGAGAFIAAAVISLREPLANRKTVCISMWASAACLVVGLLLLLSELIFPIRGIMLWQSFSHWTSWMTFGAWAVFAAVIVFVLAAACRTERLAGRSERLRATCDRAFKVLAPIGIVLGICVAAYTGILLMSAQGVPLWNTLLLPCLFTVSALDTGVALVEVVAFAVTCGEEQTARAHKLLATSVIVLVAVEALVLTVYLVTMTAAATAVSATTSATTGAASVTTLVTGSLAPEFWVLIVVCGLVLPLLVACIDQGRKHAIPGKSIAEESIAEDMNACRKSWAWVLGPAGALVGGCALRFLVLLAGVHADVVLNTLSTYFL